MTKPLGYCMANQAYHVGQQVPILKFQVTYLNEKKTFGELRAYFDTNVWNVERDGLISLDPGRLLDLQDLLTSLGFSESASHTVNYSVSSMQGDDFVSLDIKEQFILECDPIRLFTINCPVSFMFKLPEPLDF
jgi:hypothetical protein